MAIQNNFNALHSDLLLLVQQERRLTAKILELLQKIEAGRLYLEFGFANLFDYLVRSLKYSESLAYQRLAALKLCAVLPEIKDKINQGSLSLTTIARASRMLKTKSIAEKRELLLQLENKSSRQVDRILVQNFNPNEANTCEHSEEQSATQSFHLKHKVRQNLTQNFPCSGKSMQESKYIRDASGALKVKLTLELTEEEFSKLEKLKALKSHQVRNVKELINLLVDKELEKYNHTSKLASKSKNPRQIKISLKKHLLQQANYKCQHPGCEQTHYLQVDHIKSVSEKGSNDPANLQILCQQHNLLKYRKSQSLR